MLIETVITMGIFIFILLVIIIERCNRVVSLKKENEKLTSTVKSSKNNQEQYAEHLKQIQIENAKNLLRDPLTNLLGEQAFDDRYTQLINQSQRFENSFAVLVLNIDKFRALNQEYSHEICDKLLIELAQRLTSTIRQVDTMTRYAGDVFLFLLPNVSSPETVVYAAQRLLDSTRLPFKIEEKEIRMTACIGIAVYPYDGRDKKALLINAKRALQRAKANGKNLFQFYQEETQAQGVRELNLKASIMSQDFLENLSLDYQPYYNTLTNEVVCIQSVAWLNHPELGKVHFSEFARIAQNSEKMPELYEWMVRNAVTHFKNIPKSPEKPQQLMLTFTLKQMEKSSLIEKIIALTKVLSIDSNDLILDMTDDIDGANFESLKKSFSLLKENNFQIAIGILALGHFALKKITNLPINYLKVDDKLIKDISVHSESHNILERILSLANNLDIGVITEGVDREEQKKLLEGLGCYVMQGKFFINFSKRPTKV